MAAPLAASHLVTVMSLYTRIGKRCLDLAVTAAAGVVVGPVLAAAGAAIRLDSPGPVFFMQDRVGQGGEIFRLYKFRTMTDRPREVGREIHAGDPEVTRVGALLRRTKLDELPQLINVLRGDMSLVGPRPFVPSMLDGLDANGHRRLQVRPGLTGLAQVNGNIHLSWPERWVWDARYVDRVSLATDLGILARTVGVVVLGEGRFLNRPNGDRV